MYLLDSDTLIFILRNNMSVSNRFRLEPRKNLSTSVINIAELYFGAYKSSSSHKHLVALQDLERYLTIYYLNRDTAKQFGKLKAKLEIQGQRLPDADLWIAAVAINCNLTLVTHNQKHFSRIESLLLDDWLI